MAVQRAFGTLLLGPLLLSHGVPGATAVTKLGSTARGIAGKEESDSAGAAGRHRTSTADGTCPVAQWVLDDAAGGKDCDTVCGNVNMVCDNVGFGKDTPEELQAIYAEYPEISSECGGNTATTPHTGTAPVQPSVWSNGACYRSSRSTNTINYWCVRDNQVSVGKERCKADDWGNVFAYRRICPCQHSEADKCPMPSGTALTGDASTCVFDYDNAPSTAQAPASAIGDPHLQNIHGERFDLMKPGTHVLINIPRGETADKTLLRVQADARQVGTLCSDMYFQEITVTGKWTNYSHLHYNAQVVHDESPQWSKLGPIEFKVVHGHTEKGVQYLNFYVKHLGRAGAAVGGLLGEDDPAEAATPSAECSKRMSLAKRADGRRGSWSSSAAIAAP